MLALALEMDYLLFLEKFLTLKKILSPAEINFHLFLEILGLSQEILLALKMTLFQVIPPYSPLKPSILQEFPLLFLLGPSLSLMKLSVRSAHFLDLKELTQDPISSRQPRF